MAIRVGLLLAIMVGLSATCLGMDPPTAPQPRPKLSPDAPKDMPVDARTAKDVEELEKAIAPYIEKARKSYPDAKKRYLAGLPEGHHFFVVTKLKDKRGKLEQVFISVTKIEGEKITGRIANEIRTVQGFKEGDAYTFTDGELLDWLIARPDGREEGNLVGKFLDEWQQKRKK
jgi:hypothetical protein